MSVISVVKSIEKIEQIQADWDRLAQGERRFFPDFFALRAFLSESGLPFRIFSVKNADTICSLACFVVAEGNKSFTLGERRLFSLPVKWCQLFGSDVLGACDAHHLSDFLKLLESDLRFDLLSLGEVVLGDKLHLAAEGLGSRYSVTRPSRKDSVRWMIDLPETFDQFMQSMSAKSRQNLRREMRKLEADFKAELVTVTRPEQVDCFLKDGESISRLTYQWNVGQKLVNDEPTRQRYLVNAAAGRLRAHLLSIDGRSCAFSRGELVRGVFNYETPGHIPEYAKLSPGTVLLAWVIKDLIENTDCKWFDFGTGGDDVGYKSRFGNVSMPSRTLQVADRLCPYPMLLVALDAVLSGAKNVASKLLGQGQLRHRLRQSIRKYGDKSK